MAKVLSWRVVGRPRALVEHLLLGLRDVIVNYLDMLGVLTELHLYLVNCREELREVLFLHQEFFVTFQGSQFSQVALL